MKRPAVFFDRDNTLIANDGYLGNPSGVVLIDGAPDAVAAVRDLGYVTVVFSNQSGVARGMFSEEAVHAVNARLDEMLLDHRRGAVIDRHEFCPFHPDASVERYRHESDLRKPSPGMIFQAEEKLGLDLTNSWVIGDAPRDIEAGQLAGCATILIRNPAIAPSPAAAEPLAVEPDFIVASLREAAEVIAAHTPLPPPVPAATSSPEPHQEAAAEVASLQPKDAPVSVSAPEVEPSAAVADVMAALLAASKPESFPAVSAAAPDVGTARLEKLAEQILDEIRRNREQPHIDFSVSKLLAGIVQVLALAALMYAYLFRSYAGEILEVAIFLQTFTISLLIMGKQGKG